MNKIKTTITFSIIIITVIIISIFVYLDTKRNYEPKNDAQIILYGESHGIKEYYDLEFSAWKKLYDNEGMRDLFLELPYYTAEFLNLWMKANNDDILDQLYKDMDGTASHVLDYKEFFKKIKKECPETIFYGTDVGHQYETIGKEYLLYLESQGQKNTDKYKIAEENINQGREWYTEKHDPIDWAWREKRMIKNFINMHDSIGNKKIMGIYGSLHTNINDSSLMAGALKEHYGDIISCTNLDTKVIEVQPYNFGFSYTSLLFLLMLFIPNIIWSKNIPKDYNIYVKNENRILQIIEKIGQILVTTISIIFTDFNLHIFVANSAIIFSARIGYLILALVFMIVYELYWIRYFKSEKTMKDFYVSFAGVPLAGATLPVMAFALLSFYGKNLLLLISVIILGIGHIGIHRNHYKEIYEN